MKICIAGKNNIAVDCLLYSLKFYDKKDICVVLNKTDKLKNSWQKSLGFYAQNLGISISKRNGTKITAPSLNSSSISLQK